jgi:hypothetical protein
LGSPSSSVPLMIACDVVAAGGCAEQAASEIVRKGQSARFIGAL